MPQGQACHYTAQWRVLRPVLDREDIMQENTSVFASMDKMQIWRDGSRR